MAQTIFDESKNLTASGGGDDTLTQTQRLNTDSAKAQVEVDGATTSADVHIDARLADDADWIADYFGTATGVANGYADLFDIDAEDVLEVRVRVINQDGTNGGSARAILRAGN